MVQLPQTRQTGMSKKKMAMMMMTRGIKLGRGIIEQKKSSGVI